MGSHYDKASGTEEIDELAINLDCRLIVRVRSKDGMPGLPYYFFAE